MATVVARRALEMCACAAARPVAVLRPSTHSPWLQRVQRTAAMETRIPAPVPVASGRVPAKHAQLFDHRRLKIALDSSSSSSSSSSFAETLIVGRYSDGIEYPYIIFMYIYNEGVIASQYIQLLIHWFSS
jgi:hypothetical protein